MAFNLAQVGVDKKSGAPIIQRSSNFTYNNDPNGTRDIFYHFGSRLRSSSWINPNSTSFLTASRLSGGSITGPANNAVDNNTATALFTNSTNETDGFQARFLKAPFKLLEIQLNSNDPNWVVEGSNNGSNWTELNYPGFGNLGNNWFLLSLTNNTFYSYYRIVHGEPGFSKTFNTVKFFGEYQSGDISPGLSEDSTFLATHREGPGVIYLPDSGAESFPENFYTTIVHFKTGEYTYQAFPGGTTSINDNTNGVLRQGEQLLAVFDNGNWELFKVGSGIDLTTKGTLVTSDGNETAFLSVGTNGSFLVADSTSPNGLKYQAVNLTTLASPTGPVDFAGNRLTSLGAPVSPSDAVTKNYADSIAAGFDPKASCDIATTGDLDSITGLTWTPSGTGPGKTLTSNGTTATIDTITLQNGLRVLVKDQNNGTDNGIYVVSGTGSAVTLIRSTDFDTSTKVTPGAFTFITKGVANGATGFILLGNGTLVIDTNNLEFSQFAGAGAVTIASLPDTNFGTLDTSDTGRYIGWNNTTGFFELYEKAGTDTGDLVKLVDNNGTPAYPPLDGSLISIGPAQVSPLTTKGDLWTYGISNTRLPVGTDGQLLVSSASSGTGLIWKTIVSNDLEISATASDVTINFKTGTNTVELGPLNIDSSLAPNTNDFLRYDGTKFTSNNPSGTSNGDFVVLEDVGGNPGLPAVDGSQLTNVSVAQGQGSPLNSKGDIYIYDSSNTRLPVGLDGQLLIADSTTSEGLTWGAANLSVTNLPSYTEVAGSTTYTKVSNLDTNDLIYAFGTNFGTKSFNTPDPGTYIVGSNPQSDRVFDRGVSNSIAIGILILDLQFNAVYQPGVISIYSNSNNTATWIFEGSNDNSNWDLLLSESRQISGWEDFNVNSSVFYRYIKIRSLSSVFVQQIQLYGGYVNPVLPTAELNIADSKGSVTILSFPSASVWNLPSSVPDNFFTFYKNTGKEKVSIVLLDNGETLQGESTIYPQHGGLLVKTNSTTWLNINTPQTVNSKGQLLGYDNQPKALQPGTSGQVLTANTNSDLGFRWENRAAADDLIYSRLISQGTLSAAADDIFKDLQTTPYTYPASNGTVTFTTNTTDGNNNPTSLITKSFADTLRLNANQFVAFEFLTVSIQPTVLAIYDSDNNSSDYEVTIEVSNDGSTWIEAATYTFLSGQTNLWNLINLDVNGYYTHLRLLNGTTPLLSINEFKLFGWVKDNPQQGEIFAVGPTGITPIKSPADDLILVADSNESAGVKWAALPGTAFDNFRIPTSEETLSADKALQVTNAPVQVLNPGGGNRTVVLPNPAETNLYFKIVNADSNFNLNIKETAAGPVVKTLDIDTPYVECHRTATQWIILS